jgi:hypothetical protein
VKVSDEYRRPAATTDEVVAAVGKVTEALEWVERARGRVYDVHQMMGHADAIFGEAADALAEAGCDDEAALIRREVVGRNVLDGRWTFQVVDEFDDSYYEPVRATERRIRDGLLAGRRHVYEAELKDARRTDSHPDHSRRPAAQ